MDDWHPGDANEPLQAHAGCRALFRRPAQSGAAGKMTAHPVLNLECPYPGAPSHPGGPLWVISEVIALFWIAPLARRQAASGRGSIKCEASDRAPKVVCFLLG